MSPTIYSTGCGPGGSSTVFAFPGDGINGILAAWGRADNQPQFIQSRHEEMSAFEAVGYAKFTGRVGVCMATSGPGAIHLLNGLYDAKLDHVPVVAIVGQTNRSAMGGCYQQEVDLLSLYKDVASDYVQMVTVPEQLPNVLDRAIRMAMAERTPTALIIPADVQELDYSAPTHAFKMVPSSLGIDWPAILASTTRRSARRPSCSTPAARWPCLSGPAPAARARRSTQVADLLGAGAAKALLGKDVLSDELPWVTGSIGLLGTRPSYELMRDCDTLLTVGSSFPYTQFMPDFGQARGVQIDADAKLIGMRYPYEINMVADASAALRALIPHLRRKDDRSWRDDDRSQRGALVGDHDRWRPWSSVDLVNPLRLFCRTVAAAARQRDRHRRFRFVRQLVCPQSAVPWRHARIAVGQPRHHGPWGALRHRRQVRPPRASGRSCSPATARCR